MDSDCSKLADSDGPFAQRAAALLELGFSVIPVLPRAKKTIAGTKARTRDAGVVTVWAEGTYFDGNVGLCADENFTLLESDDVSAFTAKIRELTGHDIPRTLQCGSGRENRCCWIFKRTPVCDTVKNLGL